MRARKPNVWKQLRHLYAVELKQDPEGWNFIGAAETLRSARAIASPWKKAGCPTRITKFIPAALEARGNR